MIPDFKTFIRESIWSDIQDRSSGKIGRKENDIDLLDIKELCEYLKTIYKTNSDNDIKVLEIEDDDHKIDTYLVICLYEDEKGYYRYIYYNGDYINTQLDVIETLNCRSEFERKFSTTKGVNDFDVVCIDIYPKDRARVPVTNKFFIEVLDFILDRIDAPLEQQIEKITDVKESIWSDIQDRSSGDVVRKEDEKFFKTIATYIQIYVNKEMFAGGYQFGVMSEFIHFINDYANNIKIEPLNPDIDMIKRYVKKNWESLEDVFLNLHKMHKYVTLDDVMEKIMKSKCALTESVWSDIQDRSSGDVIRKEDDVNLLSQDSLFDYITDHYVCNKYELDNDHKPVDKTNSIHIPFAIPEDYSFGFNITLEFTKKGKIIIFSTDLRDELPDVYKKMCENYNVEVKTRFLSTVSPQDESEITNKFYIDLVNFLINIVDDEHRILDRK